MDNEELVRKLKATPHREICEHGSQRVKCVICDNVVLEARVAVLESEVNGPWLAADKKPDDDQYSVEVYGRSMGRNYKQLVWTSWGSEYLEPWHVWRYHDIPEKGLLDKSSRQRRKYGAVALQANGHYMKPDQSGKGGS